MSWTLANWQDVWSRLEHAMQVLPDASVRIAFVRQSALGAMVSESGFSALEAMAWSLCCLQSPDCSDQLSPDEQALLVNMITACLRVGEVSEFGHPLSFLHAELLDIRAALASRDGKAFVAYWRYLQAFQIRNQGHPEKRPEHSAPLITEPSADRKTTLTRFPEPKTNSLESALWFLAHGETQNASQVLAENEGASPADALTFRGSLAIFLRHLYRLSLSEEMMGPPVDNICDFLAVMSDILPATIELLVWGASGRVFDDKQLPNFSALCWQHYHQLSLALTNSQVPDLLGLHDAC